MLKYQVVKIKNPIDKSEAFHARLVPVTPIGLDEICQNISHQSTMTAHDVKAVLSSLEEQVFCILRNGGSVRMGDLGSFHPTLTSTGTSDASLFTTSHIKSVMVRFTPSSRMHFELSKTNPAVVFMNATVKPAEDTVV